MEDFEHDIVLYNLDSDALAGLRAQATNPINALSSNIIENRRGNLPKLSNLNDINREISLNLADLEFLNEENILLDHNIQNLNARIKELNSIEILMPDSPPPQEIDVHREQVKNLKAELGEYESQIKYLRQKHPEDVAAVRAEYITKLQKLKNELRLRKFLFKLSKVSMSQEASVHSFITREELKGELSRVSQANKLYYDQMQEAMVLNTPRPTIPTWNLPSSPDALYTALSCIIYFLLSSLISKLVI